MHLVYIYSCVCGFSLEMEFCICYSITPFSIIIIESVRKDRFICEMCYFLGWKFSLKLGLFIDLFIYCSYEAGILENPKVGTSEFLCLMSLFWDTRVVSMKSCKALCIIQRLSCNSLLQSPSTSCNTTYNASFSRTSTTSTLKHAFQVIVFMLSLDKPLLQNSYFFLQDYSTFELNINDNHFNWCQLFWDCPDLFFLIFCARLFFLANLGHMMGGEKRDSQLVCKSLFFIAMV